MELKSLVCKICDRSFPNPQGLGSHMRWHKNKRYTSKKRTITETPTSGILNLNFCPHCGLNLSKLKKRGR